MRYAPSILLLATCLSSGGLAHALDVDMDPVPRIPLRKSDTQVFLVHLSGPKAACKGTVSFEDLPDGLAATPAKQAFDLAPGGATLLVFTVRCTAWGTEDTIRPTVTIAGDEAVNFPERLKTTIVRDRAKLDKKPLNADGLLAYYSCGDAKPGEYTHFDASVGINRFWEEGIWYYPGGVKGRAVFGCNGRPYPRHRWSKIAYDPLNNLYYKRGTMLFWIRKSGRVVDVPYTPRFKGDPKTTWRIGPNAMRGHEGEGIAGYVWSPQTIYTRWHLKAKRPWKPFKPGSDCFLGLRRYKAVQGLTDGFLEATYKAMRGKIYHVQAPYKWTGHWRHVAVLWDVDQRRLEIYLDGSPAGGKVMLNGKVSTDKAWYAAPWNVMTFCNAAMSIVCASAEGGRSATDRDEYYIYNRALSAEEIGKNMRASMGKVVTPVIVPAGASFHESIAVEVRSGWSNPVHRYTTDGSEPSETSPACDKPIPLTKTTTLKIKSFLKGFQPSDTATAQFTGLGPDTRKPSVAGIWAINDATGVLVGFDEPVTKATAEAAGNYALDGTAPKAARLEPDGRTVRLTTAKPLAPGAHKLTVRNIRDRAKTPNVMADLTDAPFRLRSLPGLIGYWNFDVLDSPAVKDLSPSRIDGLAWDGLHPGIRRVEGVKGRAVFLDGHDDLVDLADYADKARQRVNPKGPHNADAGTVAVWLKGDPDGVGYKKHIVAKTYAYEIWTTNGQLMHTKNIRIVDGKWHHLAVTYQRGAKKFYLDGKLVHSEGGRFLKHHMMGVGLGVGGGGYGQPKFFKGALDEVMLFNRILTADEIRTLQKTGDLTEPPSR